MLGRSTELVGNTLLNDKVVLDTCAELEVSIELDDNETVVEDAVSRLVEGLPIP